MSFRPFHSLAKATLTMAFVIGVTCGGVLTRAEPLIRAQGYNDTQRTRPETVKTTDDPAMEPAVVHTTPGEAYADSTRAFQGVPGIARAPGGRLWATWYAGGTNEGPENYVIAVTSTDDGRSWSSPRVVIDPPGYVRACDPVLWLDPRGRLWLFYAQAYGWWDGRMGVWGIVAENPDEPHPCWSPPRRIADGVMMNKPTVRSTGDWLLPIAVWSHAPRQQASWDPTLHIPEKYLRWNPDKAGTHVYRSRDDGATFEHLGTARVPDVVSDEHMIVERHDGSLWMLVRTGSTAREADPALTSTGISESISTDDGQTWTPGKPATIPHIPSRFFIRRLASDRLLLVKHNPRMDTAWLQTPEGSPLWQRRSHLTAYLSDDDGVSWHGGLLLDERLVVSYPDAIETEDGRIILIYDHNRKTAKEILFAVFTEADVAAGALVDPRSRLRQLVNKATGTAP